LNSVWFCACVPTVPQKERITVGCGFRDAVGAVHPAGAADVFEHDRLPQNLTHALREQSRQHVVRSAGGERIDHGDRARRPFLGLDAGRHSQRGNGNQRGNGLPHGFLRTVL
jgi:hypothetical protein